MAVQVNWGALLLRVLLYCSITAVIFSFAFFYLYSHPSRYHSPGNPASLNLQFEEVSFETSDKVPLKGWFIKNETSDAVVIALHGYPMDKGNILGMVSFLAADFNLLLFDFRAMGESGGFFSTAGKKEQLDVDGAVAYLKARGFKKIGLYGFSMGAATALLSKNPDIKAKAVDSPYENQAEILHSAFAGFGLLKKPLVFSMNVWNILLSGFSIYGLSAAESVKDSKTPTLIFHGGKDFTVPSGHSAKIKAANPAIRLILIPEADHGEASFYGGVEYEKEIGELFKKNLK
ncbi:MAG: hypothetical protein COT17_02160 [Elusimicrobia bacterium CG08_land_8_20_14_0_20_51_18]|nr:MAG: hypothetical protein COT17_02160 [Elusimicrobia bacterium CG08_land_8_20_14_0_20_51_18]